MHAGACGDIEEHAEQSEQNMDKAVQPNARVDTSKSSRAAVKAKVGNPKFNLAAEKDAAPGQAQL